VVVSRVQRPAWREGYGDDVPEKLGILASRAAVTPAEFADLRWLLDDDWSAIEQHIRSHTVNRRYASCTTLPGHLCDRWCPVGGDPDLMATA